MTGLERYLTSMRDGMKELGAGTSFAEFLLRNGRAFQGRPLPSRYRLRTPKMCYFNTYQLVRHSRVLRYCQGYVVSSDLPIPIEHAWAIDKADRVVDVTLQDVDTGKSRSGLGEYFGIVFERELVLAQPDPYCGMLTDGNGIPKIELWLKVDPGFKEFLPP